MEISHRVDCVEYEEITLTFQIFCRITNTEGGST